MRPEEHDRLAAVEDRLWYFRAIHEHVWRELRRRIDPARAASLLDGGCGTGGLIRRLAPRATAWRWTGVDLSPHACAWARRRTTAEISEAPLSALPWPGEHFDAVVLADVIGQLEEPELVWHEVRRVLRPDGVMVAHTAALPWLRSYHDAAVGTLRRYTREEFAAAAERAGLVVEHRTYLHLPTLPLLAVRRKLLPAPRSGSDVRLLPPPVEALLAGLSAVEAAWVAAGGGVPIGSSVLLVARRR